MNEPANKPDGALIHRNGSGPGASPVPAQASQATGRAGEYLSRTLRDPFPLTNKVRLRRAAAWLTENCGMPADMAQAVVIDHCRRAAPEFLKPLSRYWKVLFAVIAVDAVVGIAGVARSEYGLAAASIGILAAINITIAAAVHLKRRRRGKTAVERKTLS